MKNVMDEKQIEISSKNEPTIDDLKMYLNDIGKYSLLTFEEEQELGKLIKEGGDMAIEARNQLVEANLKLVMHYAKRYKGTGLDILDINAMGCEGLIRAAEKFDYTLGYRFSTYATWWINQAISRGILEESNTVRIPVHMNENINKIKKAQKVLLLQNGEEASVEEIVEYTGLDEKAVQAALQAMVKTISIEAQIGEDEESTLENLLADDKSDNPCETAMIMDLKETIAKMLDKLDAREARVLKLRYGLETGVGMTLEDIARLPEFQVSRERIRQIELKAMKKIRRNMMMMDKLKEYVA